MMGSPPLCVVDANILIDLHIGGLLGEFFRLPLRLAAPDVIIAELHDPDGKTLKGLLCMAPCGCWMKWCG